MSDEKIINWNKEIEVKLTIKDLAIIHSFISLSSTRDIQTIVNEVLDCNLNVFKGDAAYQLYLKSKEYIIKEGVLIKDDI